MTITIDFDMDLMRLPKEKGDHVDLPFALHLLSREHLAYALSKTISNGGTHD